MDKIRDDCQNLGSGLGLRKVTQSFNSLFKIISRIYKMRMQVHLIQKKTLLVPTLIKIIYSHCQVKTPWLLDFFVFPLLQIWWLRQVSTLRNKMTNILKDLHKQFINLFKELACQVIRIWEKNPDISGWHSLQTECVRCRQLVLYNTT